MPPSLVRLVDELQRLPGIGRRTAQRLALSLVRDDGSRSRSLAAALEAAATRITRCKRCFGFAEETDLCAICVDPRRDAALVCVVEEASDVLSIERASEFRGTYHVLGGALAPIDGVGPESLTIRQLIERVDEGAVREVVVATNPTMPGEATASYLADLLAERDNVLVTRLASGLAVGMDLEHADELTLGRAFAGRRTLR